MATLEDYLTGFDDLEPLKRLVETDPSGCTMNPYSVLPVSYIELAMTSLVLQDTVLNLPVWTRFHQNDINKITGPVKRSANVSPRAGLPRKRSKCDNTQTSADLSLDITRRCKIDDSNTSKARICQPYLQPSIGLCATYGDSSMFGCNNNNNSSRVRRRKRRSSSRSRTKQRCTDRSRSRSSSRRRERSRSRSRSRSRRRRKGILKRSKSTRGSRERGERKRSKRRVRFSRKITYWE